MFKSILVLILGMLLFSCSNPAKEENGKTLPQTDHTIYYGGAIVTMEGKAGTVVEAVVTKMDKIVFTGSLGAAEKQFVGAKKHDLNGKTMFPGLIEQHLHPFLAALTLTSIEKEMTAPDEILMTWGTVFEGNVFPVSK